MTRKKISKRGEPMLLDKTKVLVEDSKSIIAFQTEGGGSWPVWDRYITINGKKAYHIGNVCGTCLFFFKQLEDAYGERFLFAQGTDNTRSGLLPEEVIDKLNSGLTSIESPLVDTLKKILPNGDYQVTLSTVTPTLVSPGQPGDYFADEQVDLIGLNRDQLPHCYSETKYYRLNKAAMSEERLFFEFLIPIFPLGSLDEERVNHYRALLNNGKMPTAVALSVLDIHSPENRRDENSSIKSHACLSNYLIDGHHKAYAAAISGKPLTLISFLAQEHGLADEDEITECLQLLQTFSSEKS